MLPFLHETQCVGVPPAPPIAKQPSWLQCALHASHAVVSVLEVPLHTPLSHCPVGQLEPGTLQRSQRAVLLVVVPSHGLLT